MFQTGLPFFVTSLLKLPETMTTLYFVGMTALSLVFYVPVNKLTPKLGKKKMILVCICSIQSGLFLYRIYGKNIVYSGNRTGADSDCCSGTSDGNFRNSSTGSCGGYCTE